MDQMNPDATLGVEFFLKAVENPRRSREEGRPIFEDIEFVRIAFPGDNKKEHVAPAHEMHYVSAAKRQMTYAERFAASYAAFKDANADFMTGTPLSLMPGFLPSEREEMERQKIRTIEQLAGLPDRVIAKMGPGWRQKVENAQAYLKRAEGTAEVDALKAKIAELEAMMKGQKAETAAPSGLSDQFEGFERDDLYNMALDAGLEPRANASRDSLVKLLAEAAEKKAKEAA